MLVGETDRWWYEPPTSSRRVVNKIPIVCIFSASPRIMRRNSMLKMKREKEAFIGISSMTS